MLTGQIQLPMDKIADFCRRWKIVRLDVFGSALRTDFGSESDVDLIAEYSPSANWSLLDRVHMKHELEDMLHRKVDLLNRRALKPDSGRAASILAEAELLYAAA